MVNKYKNRKFNKTTLKYRSHPKFNVPVIAHFHDHSVLYDSILEAEELTGINYHNIFDACIGRIWRAGMIHWEFENGRHWIKYKAKHIVGQRKRAMRTVGFNG